MSWGRSPAVAESEGDQGLTVVGEVGDALIVEKVLRVFFVLVGEQGGGEEGLQLVSASHQRKAKELREAAERHSSE